MKSEEVFQIKVIMLTLATYIAMLLHYLGLSTEIFVIYAVLLIVDYLTGIGRAYKLSIQITSKEMWAGIISKLSSLFVPILLGLGFKTVGADGVKALEVGMIILSLSEVYSSISNIHAIKTTKDLPEFDALASIARWLKAKILSYEEKK